MITTETISISLNGAEREFARGTTVASLVAELGLRAEIVAVEVNEALVRQREREARELQAGDRVEVVTLVGGG